MDRYCKLTGLALLVAALPAGAATYQTPTPTLLSATTPLNNPGIGVEQATKLLTPSGTITRNETMDAVSTIRYIRLQWSLVETADQVFDWSKLDAAINDAVANGKQAAISLMGHTPMLGGTCGYTQAIPAWYMTAAEARGPQCTGVSNGRGTPSGCTYFRTNYTISDTCSASAQTTNQWTFNHHDSAYIDEQVELIEALRAKYDNLQWAGKIAYVDVRGGLGSWTELHTDGVKLAGTNTQWPMPGKIEKERIANAYLNFQYLPLVANVRNGTTTAEATQDSQWVYLCQAAKAQGKTIGWRTDGLDATKWLQDPVFNLSNTDPDMDDCWKYGPVYGELAGNTVATAVNNDSWAAGQTGYFALNNRLQAWHASGWNNKYVAYPGDPATYKAALDEWRAIGGYRLAVTGGSIPLLADNTESLALSITLTNSGTAPVYRDWYSLKLRFVPASGSPILVPLSGDLRDVLPGAPQTFTASTTLPAGTYGVSVGVVQDPTYTQVLPLKLAHATADCSLADNTYWCALGTTTIGLPPEPDPEEPAPEEPPPPVLDTTAPVLSAMGPSAPVSGASATLSLTTNEPATCRWARSTQPWAAMTAMPTTGNTTHQATLAVKPGGVYRWCAACEDLSANRSTTSCSTFTATPSGQRNNWIFW